MKLFRKHKKRSFCWIVYPNICLKKYRSQICIRRGGGLNGNVYYEKIRDEPFLVFTIQVLCVSMFLEKYHKVSMHTTQRWNFWCTTFTLNGPIKDFFLILPLGKLRRHFFFFFTYKQEYITETTKKKYVYILITFP